ncbi:Prolactin-releasing peptide receptor [Strongyloides ratti]|uniref:Prolactin-releasing peptide receptor n=1 Tax=Strongyloides ratti TaxID=34506 RepID=A0A090LKP4_STRRB|nr:Prolactin-releasing peptide receptor [Strongyloides ratti]CEF70404.1 Prolactin-releasing peptide receptor [Strongyloides ratti]
MVEVVDYYDSPGEIYSFGNCTTLNEYVRQTSNDWSTYYSVWFIFAVIYSIIISLGIVGNLCVVLAVIRTKSLQTVPNYFIMSLSCSDMVVSTISATVTPFTAFAKNWYFGRHGCMIFNTLGGMSIIFSTLTLTAISIDRLILIRYPMKTPINQSQAFIWIFCNVAAGIIFSLPSAYHSEIQVISNICGEFCDENWGDDKDSFRMYYSVLIYAVQFVIPLTIIIICYTLISLRLNQSLLLKKAKNKNGWETDQERVAVKRKARTNRMFIGMVVAFILSYLPNVVFNILRDFNQVPKFISEQGYFFGIVMHCIAMTSTIWNPLLYAALNYQLRAAFIDLMPACIHRKLAFLKKKETRGSLRQKGGVNAKVKTYVNCNNVINDNCHLEQKSLNINFDKNEESHLTDEISVQITLTPSNKYSRGELFYKNLTSTLQRIIPNSITSKMDAFIVSNHLSHNKKIVSNNIKNIPSTQYFSLPDTNQTPSINKFQEIQFTNLDTLKEDEENILEEKDKEKSDLSRKNVSQIPQVVISDYSDVNESEESNDNENLQLVHSDSVLRYEPSDTVL